MHKEFRNKLLARVYAIYESMFNSLDDIRIFVSESEENEYNQFQKRANRDRHITIYNASERISVNPKKLISYDVGTLTRFHSQKNLTRFLEIAEVIARI